MLKLGMYVAEVDRPWLETPFATQGFLVSSEAEIDFIAENCQFVFIDPKLTQRRSLAQPRFPARSAMKRSALKKALVTTKQDLDKATIAMDRIFTDIRSNERTSAKEVENAVRPLVESVIKQQEALTALMRMRAKSDYLINHAMGTTIWATLLGRHMGYDHAELLILAMGATLADAGMANLPSKLLNKPEELSSEEYKLLKSHVRGSSRLAQESGIDDHRIIEIIECHHERHSGAGYPQHLAHQEIPINARIVAIADTYDAMTSTQPYANALTSFDAISQLNRNKDILFQSHLVDAFTQIIGIFPTGSLVELSTGEVGIVTAQNRHRRLQPEVMIILDKSKKPYPSYISANLVAASCEISITRELPTGAHGIGAENYFL